LCGAEAICSLALSTGFYTVDLAATRALTDRKGEAHVLKSHANMLVQDRIITYPPLLKLAAMIGYSIYAAYC